MKTIELINYIEEQEDLMYDVGYGMISVYFQEFGFDIVHYALYDEKTIVETDIEEFKDVLELNRKLFLKEKKEYVDKLVENNKKLEDKNSTLKAKLEELEDLIKKNRR